MTLYNRKSGEFNLDEMTHYSCLVSIRDVSILQYYESFHLTGKTKEKGVYYYGKKNGEWFEYTPEGEEKKKTIYKKGKIIG